MWSVFCPVCGRKFETGKYTHLYCSKRCKIVAASRRYYIRHKQRKISRYVASRRVRMMHKKRQPVDSKGTMEA